MATRVTLRHLFNGDATGRESAHRVATPASLLRLMRKHQGNGWGVNVIMTEQAFAALGGQRAAGDLTVIPCNDVVEGFFDVFVVRGPGRPVTTGSDSTKPIQFRVSAVQRAELNAEAARLGLPTADAAAKRRTFPSY